MKRLIFILCTLFFTGFVIGQNSAESVNKPLTTAQKTTIELSKVYNFTPEQALSVQKIQENKFQALAKIEKIKAVDMKKYIAKRLSAFETADNDLMSLLDESQLAVFKKQQLVKSDRYETIVVSMKKQGYAQAEIDKKLAETEF